MDREASRSLLRTCYANKTVWISGHTGFKGSWLATWLLDLGAKVHGFALDPHTQPALFDQLGLRNRLNHEVADIRDAAAVKRSIQRAQPDFVFHLAAQAIVRTSFDLPVDTYMTNVMGTIHVMEALRAMEKPCAAVMVTTDKCYENREWLHGYREEDPMGGFDPYSSSKGCAELAIASWRRSFFGRHPVRLASARAGNVIGGGDWAQDRIVPDCIRSLGNGQPIPVRNKVATRPWQHVLEPLSGYLWLGAVLSNPTLRPFAKELYASAFNLGPQLDSNRTVADLVTEILKHWEGTWVDQSDPNAAHEAKLLNLATDKAFHLLSWKPVWSFEKTVAATVGWYRAAAEMKAADQFQNLTSGLISEYERDAAGLGISWARPALETDNLVLSSSTNF